MDNQSHIRKSTAFIVFFLFIVTFASAFFGGFFLHQFLFSNPSIQPPIITPPPSTSPVESQVTTRYLPGKHFYDDGFYLMAADNPDIAIVVSVSRQEAANGAYQQATRISYFNGAK